MHKFLLFATLASFSGAALAQEEPQVEPDQRDFAAGTSVTPPGSFQIESSSFSSHRGAMREYRLGETLVRVPIVRGAEIRATIPGYIIDRDLGLNGLDDANLEARIQLGKLKSTAFALTIGSILPTGNRDVAERRYQPQAVFAANFKLSKKAELLANLGVGRPTDRGKRFTQSIGALSLRYDATPKINLFTEVFGFNRLQVGGKSQKFVAGGLVFYANRKTALFGRVGAGIDNDTDGPDRFFQLGLARLF